MIETICKWLFVGGFTIGITFALTAPIMMPAYEILGKVYFDWCEARDRKKRKDA